MTVGGVHVVVQRVPYRLLTLLSTLSGAAGAAAWVTAR